MESTIHKLGGLIQNSLKYSEFIVYLYRTCHDEIETIESREQSVAVENE